MHPRKTNLHNMSPLPGIIIFSLLWLHLSPEQSTANVRVSIFNRYSVSALVISPDTGGFHVVADGRFIFTLGENEPLYVSMKGDRLFLGGISGSPGIFETVSVYSTEPGNSFSIRLLQPAREKVSYHGDLELSVRYERISIINEVDENLYLAGVVEAEAGTGARGMFYRAQAVICRTYMYGNIHRHSAEGFDLCDEVHCQVYHGRLTDNSTILEAVKMTGGLVMVSGEELINAVFHANCGGQTAASGEVWLNPRPYLRPVSDPWCSTRPGASWQVRIDRDKWNHYLAGMGLKVAAGGKVDFTSRQTSREVYYRVGEFAIPYRKLRADWNFRSSFFDVEMTSGGRQLLIRGRGYGHGVGLCQEGAMEMAAKGYNFKEILQFYYTGVTIIDVEKLF
jgi:stage II sporulation protein D